MLVISGRVAKRSSSRLVTEGASSASPAVTTRMPAMMSAGGASLSRNPLAPAESAPTTYSSRSNVVSTITLGPAADPAPQMRRGSLHAVHPRHADVHEDDVGAEPRGHVDGLGTVGRLTHHLQVRLGVDHHLQAVAQQGLALAT